MPSEQQFQAYFMIKRAEWAQRVPERQNEVRLREPQRARLFVRSVGRSTLVTDFKNDARFAEYEICAFVQNTADDNVMEILSEVLGELSDMPLEPIAAELLLKSIKDACKRGLSRWVIVALAAAGIAGGVYVINEARKNLT